MSIIDIFSQAIEIPDPDERMAYVKGACGDDASLHQQVRQMLEQYYDPKTFMANAAIDANAETALDLTSPSDKPGDVVGPYKLLEQIGEGGMGVIYMAEQREPVVRRVALKIIKSGMDTKQVLARFEAERQALAMMNHPNIAKILDAGSTSTGRPYFVMELVQGFPITDYCNQYNLNLRERLALFTHVCNAIQHAHQKGIIHRDIKPSNVLVTRVDDQPVPKVIDFGIAKATEQRLTERTLFTNFHLFIGTPAYMSPEQAQIGAQNIDTRSDIYSLGVLLYELLTGRTPFSNEELMSGGYDEIRRRVRESEPLIPSRKLSSLTQQERTDIAKLRLTEPKTLGKALRGELDWIIMKALEKDRSRRFETASAFRLDVERFLRNEPVSAVAPAPVYLFMKFVGRYRRLIAGVSIVIVLLLVAIVVSLSGWQEAKRVVLQLEYQGDRLAESEREASLVAHDATLILANQYLKTARTDLARQVLKEHVPEKTRGFAWRLMMSASAPKPNGSIRVQKGNITDLAISPDQRNLAIGGIYSIAIMNLETQEIPLDIPTPLNNWDFVSFIDNGSLVRHNSQVIDLLDLSNGTVEFHQRRYPIFSPGRVNGREFPYLKDEIVWLYDGERHVETPFDEFLPVIEPKNFRSQRYFVNLLQPEKSLMTGVLQIPNFILRDTRIVHPMTGDTILRLPDSHWKSDFYPKKDLLVICSAEFGPHDGVSLYDLRAKQQIATRDLGISASAMRFSPDGSRIAIATQKPELLVWHLESNEIHSRGKLQSLASCLTYTPDGSSLITGHSDGHLRFHDLTESPGDYSEARLRVPKAPVSYAHDSVNDRLAIGPTLSGQILIYSLPDLTMVGHLDGAGHPLKFLDGGKLLSVSTSDLQWWDLDGGAVESTRPLQPTPGAFLMRPVISPDGRFLAAAVRSSGVEIQFYQIADGHRIDKMEIKLANFSVMRDRGRMKFSPDSRQLAAVHTPGFTGSEIRLYDLDEQRFRSLGKNEGYTISSVAFSPDSQHLASTGSNQIRRWDLRHDGQVFDHLFERAVSVSFSSDGMLMCTAGDNRISLWNEQTSREIYTVPWEGRGLIMSAYIDPSSSYLIGLHAEEREEFYEITLRLWSAMDQADASAY